MAKNFLRLGIFKEEANSTGRVAQQKFLVERRQKK
jgi:hypothetical protein